MDDPVRTLTRLDNALREFRTKEKARREAAPGYNGPAYEDDVLYWDGYDEARAIVGRHLKAARIERGH